MATATRSKKAVRSRKAVKTRTEAEYQDLRGVVVALARCADLTLKSDGKLGVGSGMMLNRSTGTAAHWSTQFFDALDAVGIVYDREKFFEKPSKKRKR